MPFVKQFQIFKNTIPVLRAGVKTVPVNTFSFQGSVETLDLKVDLIFDRINKQN